MGSGGTLGELGRWYLDTEVAEFAAQESVVDVRGWIAVPGEVGEVSAPSIVMHGRPLRALHGVERPDVERALPGSHVIGFDEILGFDELARSDGVLVVELGVEHAEIDLPLPMDAAARGTRFSERKARKLERIAPLLACPVCRTSLDGVASLACPGCGYEGVRTPYSFALSPKGSEMTSPEPPFSANAYAGDVREFLAELGGGLLLDAGSGLRYEYRDDTVNLEIDAYPTTDVVGSGAALPFSAASFDGVISIAVLEHVPDPRGCVAELARVLRPGGAAYIAVPFLQPYHGYPHHYFNATREGLAELFAPYFEIDGLTTPDGGRPIYSLSWILDSYRRGLPPEVAERFGQMTVAELAGDPERHVGADYVLELSDEARAELASWNLLRGRRRA